MASEGIQRQIDCLLDERSRSLSQRATSRWSETVLKCTGTGVERLKLAEAMEHSDFAIGRFRDMKMQPSLERALRHR